VGFFRHHAHTTTRLHDFAQGRQVGGGINVLTGGVEKFGGEFAIFELP